MNNRATDKEVIADFEGKAYSATYSSNAKVVTVYSEYGTKSAQIGGSPALSIARMLFREILHSAKGNGLIP